MNRAQRRAAVKSNSGTSKSKMGLSVLAATSLVSGSTALLTSVPAHATTCYVSSGAGDEDADLFWRLQNRLDDNSCDIIEVSTSILLNTNDPDGGDPNAYGPWYVDRDVEIVGVGGITFDADYESNIFQVEGGATDVTLTLRNLSLVEGDAGDDWAVGDDGGAIFQQTSTDGELHLILDDVYFDQNIADGRGGAIFIDRGQVEIIDDVTFDDSYAGIHGGTVYIENGDFIVTDDAELEIEDGYTYGDGGGVNLEFGDFLVYGTAYFRNNDAYDNGGALHIDNGSIFVDHDAEGYLVFIANDAEDGAGIYLNSGTINFKGDTEYFGDQGVYFIGNDAESDGGAIFVNNATAPVTFDAARVAFAPFGEGSWANHAEDDGGAIYIGSGDLLINNEAQAIFYSNESDNGEGGAVFLGNGDVNFVDSTASFVGNESEYSDGGAIFIGLGDVNIDSDSDVEFGYNHAENGGAVFISEGDFVSTGSVDFYRNHAYEDYVGPMSAESEVSAAYIAYGSGGALFIGLGNVDISGTSTFTENFTAEGDGGAIAVDTVVDHVKLIGSVFTSNDAESDGGAMHLDDAEYAEVTITDAAFYGNDVEWDDGGAISIDEFAHGQLTITNTRFDENGESDYEYGDYYGRFEDKGGAIFMGDAEYSEITMTNVLFETNYMSGQGGGFRIDNLYSGMLSISNSNFSENSSRDGGAFSVGYARNADITVSNTLFENNITSISYVLAEDEVDAADHYLGRDGGAIHLDNIDDGTFTVTNSRFLNNEARQEGGAVTVQNADDATLLFSGSTFTDNLTVEGDGGAIYINEAEGGSPSITFTTSTFRGNRSGDDGGAIYIDETEGGSVSITGSTFIENYAEDDGGAFYADNMDYTVLTVQNSIFTSNDAESDGGAIHLDSSADFNDIYIVGSTFTSNRAIFDDGGAISTDGDSSDIFITNSTFTSNQSGEEGGAVFIDSSSTDVYLEDSVFRSNSTNNAPAITVDSVEEADDEVDGAVSVEDHEYNGGAVYVDDAVLYLLGGNVFDSNHAKSGNGGAIYSELGIFGYGQNIFINNRADENGGAIDTSFAYLRDSYFGGNIAEYDGGAIWASRVDVVNNTFFNNQAGNEGGAIWVTGNLGEGDVVLSKAAMNTFLVNLTGNEAASDGLSIYTAGKINLFGNIFASNDSRQSHLEVGGGEGTPEFVDLGANFFTSSNDTDVLTAASSQLVSFADLTIPQEAKLDTSGVRRTYVVPLTTDSLAADAIDTTEFAATLTALNLGGLNTDQRGLPRTGKFDAGAFEVGDSTYRRPQVDNQADQVVIAPKVVLPSAPASVSIKAEGKKAIRINWTAPKTSGTGKILRYDIYRNGKKVATLPASAKTFLDQGLDSKQSYTYRIVTVGSQGNSIKSPNTKAIFPRR